MKTLTTWTKRVFSKASETTPKSLFLDRKPMQSLFNREIENGSPSSRPLVLTDTLYYPLSFFKGRGSNSHGLMFLSLTRERLFVFPIMVGPIKLLPLNGYNILTNIRRHRPEESSDFSFLINITVIPYWNLSDIVKITISYHSAYHLILHTFYNHLTSRSSAL